MDEISAAHREWAIRVTERVIGDSHDAMSIISNAYLSVHPDSDRVENGRADLRHAIQNEATRVWALGPSRERFGGRRSR